MQHLAKECLPIPVDPPVNGSVIFRNSGIKYGEKCLGTDLVENIPGSGCSGPTVFRKSRELENSNLQLGQHWVSTYDIMVDVPQTHDNLVALFSFSHEIDMSQVEISGKVCLFNFIILFSWLINCLFVL